MAKKESDDSRFESLSEYWTTERIVKTIVWFLCFVGIVVCMSSVVSMIHKTNTYNTEIEAMTKNIEVLKADIESLANADVSEDLSKSALQFGNEVADLQNKYYQLENNIRTDDTEEARTAKKNNDSAIAEYFSDGSYKGNWYFCPEIYYEWEFDTTYSFFDEEIPVIWICNQREGSDIVAYSTAIYNASTHKFSGLHTYITGLGQNLIDLHKLDDATATDTDATATDTTESTTETVNSSNNSSNDESLDEWQNRWGND